MQIHCKKSVLKGEIRVPASKSHAIRAVVIASLASGESRLIQPLESRDSKASVVGCTAFGAKVRHNSDWIVIGFGGKPECKVKEIDLLNSGTSMNMIAGIASLTNGTVTLTGDESLRSRSFGPIVKSINDLGGKAKSFQDSGKAPLKISGVIEGGFTETDGLISQPISSLLINCALAKNDTEIRALNLHEKPYVKMTMKWLDEQGISYKASRDLSRFEVSGNQEFKPFEKTIPADFSSATFPLCAAAICEGSNVLLQGLDMKDSQGDKEAVNILREMGADINVSKEGIRVIGSSLQGRELDLKDTPDVLPGLAVVGCFAEGETRIVNVKHARIKETDRISAMCTELKKMGADIEELPEGLVVRKSRLRGAAVHGYNDHRVVMALGIAGLAAEGTTTIDTAESVNVTFPSFVQKMRLLNAKIQSG